jgi:hypothetical protein
MNAPLNPRAVMGDNNPPEPTSHEAFTVHIEDLFSEARNFLDGVSISTDCEADAISALLDQIRTAAKDADKARAAEKKPHDDAAKAVQARWKPLLDRCDTAVQVCKDALAPFLKAKEAARLEAARLAREEAERQRAAAEAAIRAAQANDLASREQAEALAIAAKRADAAATRVENSRAQATGGARATTLRTSYKAEVTDYRELMRHIWTVAPEALHAAAQAFADAEVRSGKRQLPGVIVHEIQTVV